MKNYIKLILIFLFAGFVSCKRRCIGHSAARGSLRWTEPIKMQMTKLYCLLLLQFTIKFMATLSLMVIWVQLSVSALSLRRHFGMMGGEFAEYFQYLGTSETSVYTLTWSYYYTIIYWCNMIIEQFPNNNVASEEVLNLGHC